MKKTLLIFIVPLMAVVAISSCHKTNPGPPTNLDSQILHDFSYNVSQAGYNDLAAKTATLYQDVQTFAANTNDISQANYNLGVCKQDWLSARTTYETTEGFLFGPVVTQGIDPGVDTWPVSYVDIDSILNSNVVFTDSFINSLQDAEKGFHPIEFLLFGVNGTKTGTQFTSRQIQLLVALANNLQSQAAQVASDWNPSQSGNYSNQFINAGNGSAIYPTQKAAFEDIVNAMAGICDEVGNQKMYIPYIQRDSTLQESLYSNNSMTDFKNNILGAQDAYTGKYTVPGLQGTQGQSLQNFVKQYNLTIDDSLNIKFAQAQAALNGVTVTFGTAIYQQPTQLQNAMNAINSLENYINNSLMPLVQLHVTQ